MYITLSSAKKNLQVRIKSINLEHSIKKQLAELGIYPSTTFSVIHKQTNGAVMIATDHFKLALDKYIAKLIVVQHIS